MSSSDNKIPPFLIPYYRKLVSKHSKRAVKNDPIPESIDSFFINEPEVYKAIMFFPNGSGAGPNKIFPQDFKDLISKSKSYFSTQFLKIAYYFPKSYRGR